MKLHITNGDSTGNMLKASEVVNGEILVWRDVLHDGPITHKEGDAYFNERSEFLWSVISQPGPLNDYKGLQSSIFDDFKEREARLAQLHQFDEVVLWFEHDLYDQLQLAECLFHLSKHDDISDKSSMICIGEHSGVLYFHGFGNLSISQLEALYPGRQPISSVQLASGCRVWDALNESEPFALNKLLLQTFTDLPFMQPALHRFAQEYPSTENGLTRTQQNILDSIARHDSGITYRQRTNYCCNTQYQ